MSTAATPERRVAVAAVLGASVLFGTTGTAQELGPDGSTPLGVGTLRIVVGAIALWVFARRWPSLPELAAHRWLVVLGGAGVALYQPAFFAGTDRSGVALATVVALGSGPVFVGIIEWTWLRRRPGPTWAIATALTITGGAVLVFAGTSGTEFDVVGVVAALGAGLGYAVYAIAAKLLILRGVDSTVSLAWLFTLGALALLPFGLAEPLDWARTGEGVVMILHLGVLTVGLAYFLYGVGLRSLPTSTASTLTLAEPLTAAVVAVVVLDERLGAGGWAGAALVIVGLALAGGARPGWPRRRARASA